MVESLSDRREGGSRRQGGGRAVWWVLLVVAGSGRLVAAGEPAGTIVLGEAMARGATSRVRVELKAKGLFRPALPPGQVGANAKMPKPLALDVQTRLVFSERVLELIEDAENGAGRQGTPRRPAVAGRARSRGR